MRKLIRRSAILLLLVLGVYAWKTKAGPKPRAIVPSTRYHGYEPNHEAIDRAKAFTVLISNEDLGGVGRGTGILIDSMHVLTCAHMFQDVQDDLWIFPYPVNIVVKGKPVFVSKSLDLAILQLSRPVRVEHYATFQEKHYDGEPITIIGNMLGSMRWFVSFGIISGDYENFLLTDGTLHGGNSGGPWINEKGQVVALTDWTLLYHDKESDIHGGISAKTIREFLKVWHSPMTSFLMHLSGGGK